MVPIFKLCILSFLVFFMYLSGCVVRCFVCVKLVRLVFRFCLLGSVYVFPLVLFFYCVIVSSFSGCCWFVVCVSMFFFSFSFLILVGSVG